MSELCLYPHSLAPDTSRQYLSPEASGWGLCPDGNLSPDGSRQKFVSGGSSSLDVSEQCLCPDGLAPDACGWFCLRTCPGGVWLCAVFIV